MADDLAHLRATAQAGSVRRGPRDAIAALLMACLARLFARLEDMLRVWQSGQLPPPPPPRAQAEAPTAHPASIPPQPHATAWSLSAWLSGLWPFAPTPEFRAPASSRTHTPRPSTGATSSPRASRPAPAEPARPAAQRADPAPAPEPPAMPQHRPLPASSAPQHAPPHPARAPLSSSRAKTAPIRSCPRTPNSLRYRINKPKKNGPCRNRARPKA